MAVSNSWRQIRTLDDWMRDIEKRLMHEERRPIPRDPFEVVGPGFSTYTNQVTDWNSQGPTVNGFFYSDTDKVVNSPDDTMNWVGIVEATPIGQGVQRVWHYLDSADTDGDGITDQWTPVADPTLYTRSFVTEADGSRTYTDWVTSGGGGGSFTPYLQTFSFASAATVWTMTHNQGRRSLSYFAETTNGHQLIGELDYPDVNTMTLTFYYPETGVVTVYG